MPPRVEVPPPFNFDQFSDILTSIGHFGRERREGGGGREEPVAACVETPRAAYEGQQRRRRGEDEENPLDSPKVERRRRGEEEEGEKIPRDSPKVLRTLPLDPAFVDASRANVYILGGPDGHGLDHLTAYERESGLWHRVDGSTMPLPRRYPAFSLLNHMPVVVGGLVCAGAFC